MENGIFTDSEVKPDRKMLSEALGSTYKLWHDFKHSIDKDFGKMAEEWKYFGKNTWWVLKTQLGAKNLFTLTPCKGYFRITFILNDREVAAIEKSELPKNIIYELSIAKKFVEGRGLQMEIKIQSDVKNALKIIAIKMKH